MNVEYTFRTLATEERENVIALPLPHHDRGYPNEAREMHRQTSSTSKLTLAANAPHRCADAEKLRRVVDSDTSFSRRDANLA